MNRRLFPGVVCLLTLVALCPSNLACAQQASAPQAQAPAPTVQPNLLQNASFLDGTTAWQARSDDGPAALYYDPAGFVAIGMGEASSPHEAAWMQTVPVQAGASYRFSCRVHTESLVGTADVRLRFLDASGRLLSEMKTAPLAGDHDWATCARRCRAPDGAVRATLSLQLEGATAGRAYFDDACLAPDDAPPVRALLVCYDGEGAAGPWSPLAQLQATPCRLPTQGGDDLGFTLLAGKSDDGRLVQILIADSGSRSEGYRLALDGFPPGYRYTVTEAAEGQPATVIARGDSAMLNDGMLISPWHAPAMQLISVSWP